MVPANLLKLPIRSPAGCHAMSIVTGPSLLDPPMHPASPPAADNAVAVLMKFRRLLLIPLSSCLLMYDCFFSRMYINLPKEKKDDHKLDKKAQYVNVIAQRLTVLLFTVRRVHANLSDC